MKTKQSRKCKVIGCVNMRKGCPKEVPLFRVPNSNTSVLEKWVQETGDTDWLEVPLKYLKANLHMCARHFLQIQLNVTPKQTRLKQPVPPTIFNDCEGRTPLTDEQIAAWRRKKHYGAHYDDNLEKKKMQTEQLSSIIKQALHGDDHASEIGSESGVSTSTGGSAEEVSHEWAPSNLVLQIGNRLVAIPALSMPIPGME